MWKKLLRLIIGTLVLTWLFTLKNPIFKQTIVSVFPKAVVQDPRIYHTTKYGYREDHSFPLDLDSNFYSFTENLPLHPQLRVRCPSCNDLIFNVEQGPRIYNIAEPYSEIALGDRIIPLKPKGRVVRLLVVAGQSTVSLYASTLTQIYPRELLHKSFKTTFPFYVAYDKKISESVQDTQYYRPDFEREHQLGIKEDGSSIYVPDGTAKYVAADFERPIESWKETPQPMCLEKSYCINQNLFVYHFLLALIISGVGLILFTKRNVLSNFVKRHKSETVFGLVYAVTLFAIFREGIGDWAMDWESDFVNVSRLEFSPLYTGLYQALAYLFYLLSYSARSIFCLSLFLLTIYFYRRILRESIRSKIMAGSLLGIALFSPVLLINVFHTQRYYFASLFVILGLMLTAYNALVEKRDSRVLWAAFLVLVLGTGLRMDFVFYLLPPTVVFLRRGLSKKRVSLAFLILIAAVSIAKLGTPSSFQRSYLVASMQYAFLPYYDKYKDHLSEEQVQWLKEKNILEGFMPFLTEAEFAKFSTIFTELIAKEPSFFFQLNIQRRIDILRGPLFYRGLNIYGNNPTTDDQRNDIGVHTLQTVNNDLYFKRIHQAILGFSKWASRFGLGYFYFALLLPVLFVRRCPLSGVFGIAFLLRLASVFFMAPADMHLYVEELLMWMHFFFGVLLAEWHITSCMGRGVPEVLRSPCRSQQ